MDAVPKRTMSRAEVDRLVCSRTPLILQVRNAGAVEPRTEDFRAEFGDSVRLVTVSDDDLPGLADRLSLDCLPSVLLVKRGEVFDRFLGCLPRRLVAARVRAMLDAA